MDCTIHVVNKLLGDVQYVVEGVFPGGSHRILSGALHASIGAIEASVTRYGQYRVSFPDLPGYFTVDDIKADATITLALSVEAGAGSA